ncbi:uncharacterized protein LOC144003735 [Festucalex cinctus]
MADSTTTIVLLFFVLVGLVVLLVVLYKRLNKETNGEYTLRHVVYKEGGLRDGARRVTAALRTRLGVPLWPRGNPEDDGEEMRDFQEEPRQKGRRCSSRFSSSSGSQPGEGEDEDGKPQMWGVKARRESETEEASTGPDVFVNLNHFSGSVMWSEEDASRTT